MKKFILLFVIAHCTLLIDNCISQWQPDTRLTNAAGFSTNSDLSSSGANLHAVWQDTRDGNSEIFYKRSTNEGLSWEGDIQLTDIAGSKSLPTVSAEGSNIHVTWQDNRNGNFEIYYKRSTNNGVNWDSDLRLTNNTAVSGNSVVSAAGTFVNVIWRDTRSGNYEIFYKRSTDNGNSWSADTMLTQHTTGLASSISLASTGTNLHIAWSDSRHNDDYEIYYKRSTNGGVSWGTDTRLTNSVSISESPSIASNSSEVHVVWTDLRDTAISEVYYKRSGDNGNNWSADTRLTVYANAMNPAILLSGSIVHITWHTVSGSEIFYNRSLNSGNSWETGAQISSSLSGAYQPNITVTGTKVHIIWHDVRNGSTNSEIYYDFNPAGNTIGISTINTEVPGAFSLSQNYPNPFNPVTNIKFQLPNAGFVKLTVFDVLGREVETLVNGNLNAGTHNADWNASNHPSGVYFYILETEGFKETKKMILTK